MHAWLGSYNKPYSVMAWLAAKRPLDQMSEAQQEADEFVLTTDADMIFRQPIDPVALGAARSSTCASRTPRGHPRDDLGEGLTLTPHPDLQSNP